MVIAMPQGLTSDILPFSDQVACHTAQDELNSKFRILPLGKGEWVYIECLPTGGKKGTTL